MSVGGRPSPLPLLLISGTRPVSVCTPSDTLSETPTVRYIVRYGPTGTEKKSEPTPALVRRLSDTPTVRYFVRYWPTGTEEKSEPMPGLGAQTVRYAYCPIHCPIRANRDGGKEPTNAWSWCADCPIRLLSDTLSDTGQRGRRKRANQCLVLVRRLSDTPTVRYFIQYWPTRTEEKTRPISCLRAFLS